MWGPKCEKVQMPCVLRLKHRILSMRVWRRAETAGRTVKVLQLRKIRGSGTCDCVVTHA